MKRKYNALYRLRKKSYKISTVGKVIFTPPIFKEEPEMKILLKEFHFVIQTELF